MATASDPVAVVTKWMDALNKGDAAAAASSFASDGMLAANAPCLVTTPCTGPAILARFQGMVAVHNKFTIIGSPIAVGNLVQIRRELRNDNSTAAGVERLLDTHQEMVQGDKIVSDIGVNDYSDAQTVKLTIWQQASATGSPAAKPAASAAASAKPAG